MKIDILTIGTKMPAWVATAYQEYAGRLPAEYRLNLHELPLKRSKNTDITRAKNEEWDLMQKHIPKGSLLIALDEKGEAWSSTTLAHKLQTWRDQSLDVSFIVGGPDGLATDALKSAKIHWSLSALTLPHPLVRVMIAEQLYRAVSILQGHPYHRV